MLIGESGMKAAVFVQSHRLNLSLGWDGTERENQRNGVLSGKQFLVIIAVIVEMLD